MRTIDKIRTLFAAPKGDEQKIIRSISKFFEEIDAKKKGTLIGRRRKVDYAKLFQEASFPATMLSEDDVVRRIVQLYDGVILWSHPLVQVNVVPPPTALSIAAAALAARYNENTIWDNYSMSGARSEVMAIGMLSDLIGFDKNRAGGIFTFGGTGGNLYAARIGIEKADPNAKYTGIRDRIHILCSDVSHYSIKSAAIWTGIGLDNVKVVPTDDDGVMDMKKLRTALRKAVSDGARIGTIFATMGTTDAFSIDPLREIVALRDEIQRDLEYRIHVHADAVIGWPYLTFKDDKKIKHLPSPLRAEIMNIVSRMADVRLADSVGVDFHKTGWSPYLCSAIVVKNKQDFLLLNKMKKDMPYLYHGSGYQPGTFTLESSRPNYAQQALVNMMLLGKEGYEALIVHLLGTADYLREKINGSRDLVLLNGHNPAFVTDFRIYPDTKYAEDGALLYERELHDQVSASFTKEINDYNRRIALLMDGGAGQKGMSMISYTDSYKTTGKGRVLVALKSYPMSPFTEKRHMDEILKDLYEAKKHVGGSL
jgi:glutamate/tyrosine decarboxylase-like PLP-dependent enzyme